MHNNHHHNYDDYQHGCNYTQDKMTAITKNNLKSPGILHHTSEHTMQYYHKFEIEASQEVPHHLNPARRLSPKTLKQRQNDKYT